MSYRVYYSDTYSQGTIYSSVDGGRPPTREVQIIVQTHPDIGWHTQSGYDFYVWRAGRYIGVDRAGLFDQMKEDGVVEFNVGSNHKVLYEGAWVTVDEYGLYEWIEQTGYALLGKTLTRKEFDTIMKRALKDLGAAKTGWFPGEKRPDG